MDFFKELFFFNYKLILFFVSQKTIISNNKKEYQTILNNSYYICDNKVLKLCPTKQVVKNVDT